MDSTNNSIEIPKFVSLSDLENHSISANAYVNGVFKQLSKPIKREELKTLLRELSLTWTEDE